MVDVGGDVQNVTGIVQFWVLMVLKEAGAYGVSAAEVHRLVALARPSVRASSVYSSIGQMTAQTVAWAEPVPNSGRRWRRYRITPGGRRALADAQDGLMQLSEALAEKAKLAGGA